jgi:hypothetical protein
LELGRLMIITVLDIVGLVGCLYFIDDGIAIVALHIVFVNTIVAVVDSVNITAVAFDTMPTVGFGTIILAVSFDCIIPLTVFAISNIPTAVFYTLPSILFLLYSFIFLLLLPSIIFFLLLPSSILLLVIVPLLPFILLLPPILLLLFPLILFNLLPLIFQIQLKFSSPLHLLFFLFPSLLSLLTLILLLSLFFFFILLQLSLMSKVLLCLLLGGWWCCYC